MQSRKGKIRRAARTPLLFLSAFVSDAAAFGVTELSQQLGMTKNMVHRALTTLVDQGYLVRDAAGTRYESRISGRGIAELQICRNLIFEPFARRRSNRFTI